VTNSLLSMNAYSRAELDALIAEATVDAYDIDEQLTGFYTMIEDNLALPFDTQVLGSQVTVDRVDLALGASHPCGSQYANHHHAHQAGRARAWTSVPTKPLRHLRQEHISRPPTR
jgi:calcium binding protein